LPRGLPFRLTTDLALPSVDFHEARKHIRFLGDTAALHAETRCVAGGFFSLAEGHAAMLLGALPPVIHIHGERERSTMRWILERMREELGEAQPGGSLVAQQLAYMLLVQALRLHLRSPASTGQGWLPALANKQMSAAIAAMHRDPGRRWTLDTLAATVGMSRSVFALRFRAIVGTTPMEYLTRWRMLLAAERIRSSDAGLSEIASGLGYDSESAFGKAFRRIMGSSPRQHMQRSA
jgi:AraC-like DNA-binding protein